VIEPESDDPIFGGGEVDSHRGDPPDFQDAAAVEVPASGLSLPLVASTITWSVAPSRVVPPVLRPGWRWRS
jgi:hypothetical protein